MHTRRALLVSDQTPRLAWLRRALSPLDLSLMECATKDLTARFVDARIDLIVADCDRFPAWLLQSIEKVAFEGRGVSTMFVIGPEEVSTQQLPSRFKCDFFVRGGTSSEFVSRVRSLVWPDEEVPVQEPVQEGDLKVDLATHQAYRGGELLDLPYRDRELLTFLVTHPGRVYSREVLLSRVWGADHHNGLRTVDVHVRRIRSQIGTELSDQLETVRNVGYLWRRDSRAQHSPTKNGSAGR